jgi:hypothetical protein
LVASLDGPRTPEEKAAVRLNAMQHGLLSRYSARPEVVPTTNFLTSLGAQSGAEEQPVTEIPTAAATVPASPTRVLNDLRNGCAQLLQVRAVPPFGPLAVELIFSSTRGPRAPPTRRRILIRAKDGLRKQFERA